jgi:hypothetical protein
MDHKSFFYFADGSLTVIEDGVGHEAVGEEWRDAGHALIRNADEARLAYVHRPLFVPPEDR